MNTDHSKQIWAYQIVKIAKKNEPDPGVNIATSGAIWEESAQGTT